MTTKRILALLMGGLTLVAPGLVAPGPANALVELNEQITCDFNGCLDTYKVKCGSTKTRCVCTNVVDTVGGDDTMVVTLVGVAPAAMLGKGAMRSNVGQTANRCLCRPGTTTGPLTVVLAVSVTANGPTNYGLDVWCTDKTGTMILSPLPTVTLVTDE